MKNKKYNGKASAIKGAAALIDGLRQQYSAPEDAALLAAILIELGWSPSLARQLTGANDSYLFKARHLTSQETELVASGAAKLYTFNNGHGRNANGNGATY